jgi:ATP-dependent protease ClpP protease subunit
MSEPQQDVFALVEGLALARPDGAVASEQPPQGIPAAELDRIQKWLAARPANHAAFAAKAQGADVELSILGVIGGGWFGDGISARTVKNFLDQNKEAKTIRVLMDSPGGDYFDGVAIMNMLKRHAARVTVEVIGEATSAGSVIAMGADEVEMHAGTVMMVHRAWSCMCGNGDDMRATAGMLDRIDDGLSTIYAARTGKPREEVDALVAATTYMSPKEAVEKGFADRELPAKAKPAPTPSGSARAQAKAPPTPQPKMPPAPEARQPSPALGEEINNMALPKIIITALALADDADENAVVAAVNKLKASAKVGADIEQLLGASGQAALGAVRALKESAEANASLGTEVAKLKIVNVRRDFDALIAQGTDPKARKLSPAVAKHYKDKLENALKLAEGEEGDADAAADKASDICDDLRGFLAVAPRIATPRPAAPPTGNGGNGDGQAMQHGGKSFEAMTGTERHRLKNDNPELYNLMREDAEARGAL